MRTIAAPLWRSLAALALAGCDSGKSQLLQGWVEADLIFVAPDEQGRVETLKVREGDRVEKGDLLFTVDDDLQQADVVVQEATRDHGAAGLRPRPGTAQDRGRHAEDLRRRRGGVAAGQGQSRPGRRRGSRAARALSPVDGTVQQIYFRPGEMVPAGRPVLALLPPGNLKIRFFVPETLLPAIKYRRDASSVSCDGCATGLTGESELHRRAAPNSPRR